MNDAAFRDHVAALKTACHGPDIAVDLGLRRKGKRFFCPSCQPQGGRTPDLDVFDLGFKCYKCGLTGDVVDLAVLAGSMSKADAFLYLQKRSGINPPKGRLPGMGRAGIGRPGASLKAVSASGTAGRPPAARIAALRETVRAIESGAVHDDLYAAFIGQVCQPVFGTPGAAYLEGRGIAADVADRFGIRFCADLAGLWTLADRKVIKVAGLSSLYVFQKAGLPFLVFPYVRRGKPVFIKTRSLLSKDDADRREVPRFLNTGGIVPCLWNHDAVADADKVIITEGEIDALSWIVMGKVAVGLPGWSHWKDAWIRDFVGKEVFLDLDADAAGQKGVADIAKRFQKAGLPCPLTLARPKDQKDANDLLQAFMKDGKTERMKS
jgi:hypothetical protein